MDASKGKTFTTNEEVTAAKLHQLVDSATVSNILLSDFTAEAKPVFKSGTAPINPIVGQMWLKTDFGSNGEPPAFIFVWNGSFWYPIGGGYEFTNNSGETINIGDCVAVEPTGDMGVARPDANFSLEVLGLAASSAADGNKVIVQTHGPSRVRTLAGTPINWGAMRAVNSSFSVVADVHTVDPGTFGRLLDTTNGYCYLTGLLGGTN